MSLAGIGGLTLDFVAPAIDEVRALQQKLQQWLVLTPVLRCVALEDFLAGKMEIHGKLEFLQHTGTFKPRGVAPAASGPYTT